MIPTEPGFYRVRHTSGDWTIVRVEFVEGVVWPSPQIWLVAWDQPADPHEILEWGARIAMPNDPVEIMYAVDAGAFTADHRATVSAANRLVMRFGSFAAPAFWPAFEELLSEVLRDRGIMARSTRSVERE